MFIIWYTDHVNLWIHLPSMVSTEVGRWWWGAFSQVFDLVLLLWAMFFFILTTKTSSCCHFQVLHVPIPKFNIPGNCGPGIPHTQDYKSSGYKGSAPELLIRSSWGACKSLITSTSHQNIYLPLRMCNCFIISSVCFHYESASPSLTGMSDLQIEVVYILTWVSR